MPKLFRNNVRPDAGGRNRGIPASRAAGFRVYKNYRHRKNYERDYKRRWRNVQLVELRFPDLLHAGNAESPEVFDRLLSSVFNQMKCIRPHLVEYLQKHPHSLVEQLRSFFGVPVTFGASGAITALPSTSAGTVGIRGFDGVPGQIKSASAADMDRVSSLMNALSRKQDEVWALESQVYQLSKENTELALRVSNALYAVSRLQMDKARIEHHYTKELIRMTDASYAASKQLSKLHGLAHRQREQLILQGRLLFKTENALAMQCYLNVLPYPALGPDSTILESPFEAEITDRDLYLQSHFESFFLNDRDCSTSAYHSDVYGSLHGVEPISAASLAGKHPYLEYSSRYYGSEYPFTPFEGDTKLQDNVGRLYRDFGETLNLRIGSATSEQQLIPSFPTVPALPLLQPLVKTPVSPLFGDTKVRELQTEISVLQNKIQRYVHDIRSLKRENERLRSGEHIPTELRGDIEVGGAVPFGFIKRSNEGLLAAGTTTPAIAVTAADLALEPPVLKEDTKVKELKAEISILQKQIQRYVEEAEDNQVLQTRLRSEEAKNRELCSELTMAQHKLDAYQDETEALLRPYKTKADALSGAQQSSTVVSCDNDEILKPGPTMSDVRKVFSSLNERTSCFESENIALRSQLDVLNNDLDRLKRENSILLSDARAAGCLTLDRLLHTVTDALGKVTRVSLDELETVSSEGGTPTFSQVSHDRVLDERGDLLEYENQLYSAKLSSMLASLHDSSMERFQLLMTIARLRSDLHNANQLLQRFNKQSTVVIQTSNELDAMRAKCAVYDDQVDKLKQMNTDLSDLNNRLTDEIRALEEKGAFSGSEILALREEVKQLQSLLVGGHSMPHDAIRDRVSIIQLEGRCKLLDEYLTSCRSQLESLRIRNADLVKSVMELRYSLEQQRASNTEYARQVSAMSESEGRLRNQLDIQQSQIEGLRASVSSLNESLEKSAADLTTSAAQLAEKERSERTLASKVETLSAALKAVFTSIRDAKPFLLSSTDLNSIDLSAIPNFDQQVYYGILDVIQKSMVDHDHHHKDRLDATSVQDQVNFARDKVSNVLKCNYLLSSLASGLCHQVQVLSAALLSNNAQTEGAPLSSVVKALCEQVNGDILRADFSIKIGKFQAHNKELKTLVHQLYKKNPAEVVNRLKNHYEDALTKCQVKIEQLSTVVKANEEEHLQLKQENAKLMSDCTGAAHALSEFERRIEALLKERSSLCEMAMSLLPSVAQSDCERDNLHGILIALRGHIAKSASYKEKYQKLLETPPEPKVVAVPVPEPVKPPAEAPARVGRPQERSRRRTETSDSSTALNHVIMDVDTNMRYYLKTIKSSLRSRLRDLASHTDGSDTDYESPQRPSYGRSDTTVDDDYDYHHNGLDSSDTDTDEPIQHYYYDETQGKELVRRHTRQFDMICDLLERVGKAQSQLMERSSRLTYMDKAKITGGGTTRQHPGVIDGDMAVMHHFSRLCSAMKEFLAGSPLTLTVDDVFYQLELVMLDSGDRDRRRALWNRSIGDLVSVVIEVLQSGTFERRGTVEELERRCQVAAKALDEAQTLCRIREEELHRRNNELKDSYQRLEETKQRCLQLEIELSTRVIDPPRYDEREIRALESELSYREDETNRLSKELAKLQSVVIDLEEVNTLLSQQLERARSEANRLGVTVDKQQRQISSLNSELSHLELEAERLRRNHYQ